jgi:transposase-like protein
MSAQHTSSFADRDETSVRVKGKWVYLYRAVDSTGATIDLRCRRKRRSSSGAYRWTHLQTVT